MFRASNSLSRLAAQSLRIHRPAYKLSVYPIRAFQAGVTRRFASIDKDDPPPPKPKIDYEKERKIAEKKLGVDPQAVTLESSTRKTIETASTASGSADPDMTRELKHDLGVVADTFKLSTVPRESRILGLLGTAPYFATSLSTLYLAYDLHHEGPTGYWTDAFFINHDTARYLASLIEPVQLGYGAVIISFLGAIHWGLEYAEKQPLRERTRFRYGVGLGASIVAWPTMMLPFEFALTGQFLAFVGLYFLDARATRRGWAPSWYGTYRFLLTGLVGVAILISLLGRSEILQADHLSYKAMTSSLERKGIEDKSTNWAKLEAEEKKRIKKEKEEKEKKEKEKEAREEKKKNKDGKDGKKSKDSKAVEEKGDDDMTDTTDDKDKNSEKDDSKSEDDKSDKKDDSNDDGKQADGEKGNKAEKKSKK